MTGANAASSAIVGQSTSLGTAIQGLAVSGYGVYGLSSGNNGVYGLTNNGGGGFFGVKAENLTTNTANTEPVLGVFSNTTNTATTGFGGSINFYNETDNGTSREANKIESEWTTVADATRVSRLTITGASSATLPDIVYFEGNKSTKFQGAVQQKQGTNIASASSLTLPTDGNVFFITGTTQIDEIVIGSNWQSGSEITLVFEGSLTVKELNAGSGVNIELADTGDFATTANDVLKLVYVSTLSKFLEVSRSTN